VTELAGASRGAYIGVTEPVQARADWDNKEQAGKPASRPGANDGPSRGANGPAGEAGGATRRASDLGSVGRVRWRCKGARRRSRRPSRIEHGCAWCVRTCRGEPGPYGQEDHVRLKKNIQIIRRINSFRKKREVAPSKTT
jgi:hypothetical protein